MKQFKNLRVPHKLKILLQSPGFRKNLKLLNHFDKKYQQAKGYEKAGLLFLLVMLVMNIINVISQLGLIGKILVFLAGLSSIMVVSTPIIMLILKCRWKIQLKRMNKLLKQHHLQQYSHKCLKLSRQMIGKKKA